MNTARLARRGVSAVLVAGLALGLPLAGFTGGIAPASAVPLVYSMTVSSAGTEHAYEAYQIFSGSVSTDLSLAYQLNPATLVWGSGVTEAGRQALGDPRAAFESASTDEGMRALTETLVDSGYLDESTALGAVYNSDTGRYIFGGLTPGCYLVKDVDGSGAGVVNFAYMPYMLRVVGNVDVEARDDAPALVKLVANATDVADDSLAWNKTAALQAGDTVAVRLNATLPDGLGDYDIYRLEFVDGIAGYLELEQSSLRVSIDDVAVENAAADGGFSVSLGVDAVAGSTLPLDGSASDPVPAWSGSSLTLACPDVIALGATAGSRVTVEYRARVTADPSAQGWSDMGKATLSYSNNPNAGGEQSMGTTSSQLATATLRVEQVGATQAELAAQTKAARQTDGLKRGLSAVLFGAAVLAVAVVVGFVTRKSGQRD